MVQTSHMKRLVAFAILALFGAGCTLPFPAPTPGPGPGPSAASPQAFGKLPPLPQAGQVAEPAVAQNLPSAPTVSGMPMLQDEAATANVSSGAVSAGVGVTSPGIIARPIPAPYPDQASVEYTIDTDLPSWDAQGNVLSISQKAPNASTVSSVLQDTGIPSQAAGPNATYTSFSLQWQDTQDMTWTFDASNGALNVWKQLQQQDTSPLRTYPDPKELIASADAFLNAKGFNAIATQGGVLQNQDWLLKGTPGAAMPCPMNETAPAPAPGAPVQATDAAGAEPMMMQPSADVVSGDAVESPSVAPDIAPCGWWSQQATVEYPSSRDGRAVVDLGGQPSRSAIVNVELKDKTITGANIQLNGQVDRSAYPLISTDVAKKRLQAGGQDPVWPYGSAKTIHVSYTQISLVYLRYQSWTNGMTHTYEIPALLAIGTVDRGTGKEDYRTVVPLVDDAAFSQDQAVPPRPIPLKGETVPMGGPMTGVGTTPPPGMY